MNRSESAQLYTIEAIATSLMLLLVVIFVIKAAPLTPLTSSASHPHIEAQLETRGHDLLTTLDYIPSDSQYSPLKEAIRVWDGTTFLGQNQVRPLNSGLSQTADALKEALAEDGIAYNLEVLYNTNPSGTAMSAIIWNGRPSDNAVTVSKKIILHDGNMNSNPDSPINDIDPVTKFYNSVDVRLTLWRM